jgi:hypothetical protein
VSSKEACNIRVVGSFGMDHFNRSSRSVARDLLLTFGKNASKSGFLASLGMTSRSTKGFPKVELGGFSPY